MFELSGSLFFQTGFLLRKFFPNVGRFPEAPAKRLHLVAWHFAQEKMARKNPTPIGFINHWFLLRPYQTLLISENHGRIGGGGEILQWCILGITEVTDYRL